MRVSSASLQLQKFRSSQPGLAPQASGCECSESPWYACAGGAGAQAHAASVCSAHLGSAGSSDCEVRHLVFVIHGDVEVTVGSSHHAPRHLCTHTSIAATESNMHYCHHFPLRPRTDLDSIRVLWKGTHPLTANAGAITAGIVLGTHFMSSS